MFLKQNLKGAKYKKLSKIIVVVIFFINALIAVKLSAQNASPLKIIFKNMVDSQVMQLGNTYHNPFGEEYTIQNFKYYISNISFQKADGKTIKLSGHYLVNEDDSDTRTILLSVKTASFKALSFSIGVDSIYNVSGAQTGDLDPAKGMFWTWNSGYIMAKLEASSPLSKEPRHSISYHIGGFKKDQQTLRTVSFTLPAATGKINEIVIQANANNWFNGVHPLKIADHAACSTPGQLAVQYADNYSRIFTLSSVK